MDGGGGVVIYYNALKDKVLSANLVQKQGHFTDKLQEFKND